MILKKYLELANVKQLLITNQVSLIKELVKASLINLPFQNITTFGAFLPCERATPSFKQIVSSMVRGEGGLCGHLNNHIGLQLETLGFHIDLVSGCFNRTGVPMSHYLIKVTVPSHAVKGPEFKPMEPRPNKTYLVDVGCGVPLCEPIDLGTLPYNGIAGGLRFKYERVDETTIQRVNECGDAIIGQKPATFKSPQDYTIDLVPRKYNDFKDSVHSIYSNPRSVYLHQGIYCYRYLNISKDDFQIVCARGTDLMFITKDTRHVQSFGSYAELKPSLLKYFPMVSAEAIELTVKHFSIPFEQALKMTSKLP